MTVARPAPTATPTASEPRRRPAVVRFRSRSFLALLLASIGGLTMFLWPLLVRPAAGVAHSTDAPFVFVVILPVIVGVVLAEIADGMLDIKALAMLGVLAAIGAALRPLGAGTAGIELVFFLLVLAGRVYGPGFGFVLGATTLFTSALITGGVGPWLPFQMLAAGWVGLGAGLLPRSELRGRWEIAMLGAYGVVSAYAFGFLMNMWFWPYTLGTGTQLSYVAGDSVVANLHRFVLYTFATSTIGWDTGRAITNLVAIVVAGPTVLFTLRRSVRRAAFDAPAAFHAGSGAEPSLGSEPATGAGPASV